MQFYLVGGSVRDRILGQIPNDHDFAVDGVTSFEEMIAELKIRGFEIFQSKPEFLTVRAKSPNSTRGLGPLKSGGVADFVMCRSEGSYSDGRRPDSVEPGTILEDLARRDFTVNAIAQCMTTNDLIDPFKGAIDLRNKCLRFVGDPEKRISEDGLRVMRGYRFMVTKGLIPETNTKIALCSYLASKMLGKVAVDRIREELTKMFAHDTWLTMKTLVNLPEDIYNQIFRDGLRLIPTQKTL